MRKTENRLKYWFCSCFVSLTRYAKLYYINIQYIAYISYNIYQISIREWRNTFVCSHVTAPLCYAPKIGKVFENTKRGVLLSVIWGDMSVSYWICYMCNCLCRTVGEWLRKYFAVWSGGRIMSGKSSVCLWWFNGRFLLKSAFVRTSFSGDGIFTCFEGGNFVFCHSFVG